MAMQQAIGQMHLMQLTTQEVRLLLALRGNQELSKRVYRLAQLPQPKQAQPVIIKEEEKRPPIQQPAIQQPQTQQKRKEPQQPQIPNDDEDDSDDSLYDDSSEEEEEEDIINNNNNNNNNYNNNIIQQQPPPMMEAVAPPKPRNTKEAQQYDADLEFARKLQEQYHRFEGGGDNANKPPPVLTIYMFPSVHGRFFCVDYESQ